MVIGILGFIFTAYCVVGCVVGWVAWCEEKWPVRKIHHDNVGGLGTYVGYNMDRTILFALVCGPLFWISISFYTIFARAAKLLKHDEEVDEG